MTRLRTALLLAGGAGTKFWPYNVVRNKTAFPIANVPAIRRLADTLVALGIRQLVVVVGPGEGSVRAALRGCAGEIRYVRQNQPEGTAAAVVLGSQDLGQDVLVVSGDAVTARENLEALLTRFDQDSKPAVALVQALGNESPRDWITAYPAGDDLLGVMGHARSGSHRLCGIYALTQEAIDTIQDNPGVMSRVPVGGMPPVEAEIAQSLQIMIDEGTPVAAVQATGYHVDLDKPWHILEANHHVIRAMSADIAENVIPASAQIHDGAEIRGRLVLGENTVIGNRVVIGGDLWLDDGARIENGAILEGATVVGADTRIRHYCQIGGETSIGPRNVHGHGAEFSGVALDTVYCYHYCEIWGVVGQAVDLGAATVCGNLRFDDAETTWRIKGRPETPLHAANAAYLGDFSRTGVNAILMPGRRVGVYSCLGPGVVAYSDVPDRQAVLVKQELEQRPWGPEKYGW